MLSIILLGFKNKNNFANIYLVGFLFSTSFFCLSSYIFFYSNSIHLTAHFISSIPSIYFLIGPFFYFYFRSIVTDHSKLSFFDYFHFLLFLIVFSGSLPFLFSNWNHKLTVTELLVEGFLFNTDIQTNSIIPKHVNHLIRPFHTLFYIFLSCKLLTKQRKNHVLYSNKFQYNLIYTWIYCLIILLTIATFAQIFGLFNLINIKSKHILFEESRVIVKVLIVDYFLINLILILFPKIMYGLPIENLQNNGSIVSEPFNRMKVVIANHEDAENSTTSSSVEKSPLFLFTDQYVDEMDLHIKCCIKELHYLDPNFQMDSLCKSFNIPYHHWTFYFNDIKQQTFIEWKNRTRINYAKEKIINGYLDSKTFQSLATECGFNTQSTFIRVFKIYTGKNPGDYIKSI